MASVALANDGLSQLLLDRQATKHLEPLFRQISSAFDPHLILALLDLGGHS
jgi:hypothetical protein